VNTVEHADRHPETTGSVRGAEVVVRRTPLSLAGNLVGAVVVLAFALVAPWRTDGSGLTVGFVLLVVSILLWSVAGLLPHRHVRLVDALLVLMILVGAVAAWSTDGLSIAPVIGGVVQLTARGHSAVSGYVSAGTAGVIIAVDVLVQNLRDAETVSVGGLLAMEAGILVAVFGGVARRNARQREAAARETAALADRQALARELHDVLAHSLGGLVIQLDATDAQLEAGQVEKARARLEDAREMASSGLAEARRAVEALRAPPAQGAAAPAPVPGVDLVAQLSELVEAHERLGGVAEWDVRGTPGAVTEDAGTALRRALQESLSNVRKHAAGQPVRVSLTWATGTVELAVSNPVTDLAAADGADVSTRMLAASGAGRGLAGMRERFDALPGGHVSFGPRDGGFEVHAETRVEVAK
jgi:signal transduction histidine kinase